MLLTLTTLVLLHSSFASANETRPPNTAVLFQTNWGTGPYDRWRYPEFESAVFLTPIRTMRVTAIPPKIFSCDGQCTYTLIIHNTSNRELLRFTERETKPKAFDGILDTPITFQEGKRYKLLMSVDSSKAEVGIYTAGSAPFPNHRGLASIELIEAHRGLRPLTERGPLAFMLQGTLLQGSRTPERR